MPTQISTLSELNSQLSKSRDKLSVIKFEATWCGPCHAIAPAFQALSDKYRNVNFFKVDVDQAREVAQEYRITAMPTFVFLKGSSQVDQVRGANKMALEDAVKRHSSGSSSGAFSGKGQTLGGSATNSASGESTMKRSREASTALQLDPQFKVLLLLLAGYLFLYWISG